MENEDEAILLALADTIAWHYSFEDERENPRESWAGQGTSADYIIYGPDLSADVDANPERRFTLLYLYCHDPVPFDFFYIPTVAQAKLLCASHALSGDLSEIQAVHEAAEARNQVFRGKRQDAQRVLYAATVAHKPARLKWHTTRPTSANSVQCRAKSKRGTYIVTFDPIQRWLVTVIHEEQAKEEHAFLTLAIAEQACKIHAHTGEWYGTLSLE